MSLGHISLVINMKTLKATTLCLGELNQPVITFYHLGIIVHRLYRDKCYQGESLDQLKKPAAERRDVINLLSRLKEDGVLGHYKGLSNRNVFSLLGRSHESVVDVICTIDPFCYLSHLSAMEYHGLTDRIPSKIIVSTPSPTDWRQFAETRMASDIGDDLQTYLENSMPPLQRIKINKIGRQEVQYFSSVHLGAFRQVRDRMLRVSTMGRTFLDMLRNPELCGGINHVLAVYDEFSSQYLKVIIDEIHQHGKPIDKVRAGYILEERLKIQDNTVNSWQQYAQRGGSRKLDSSADYEAVWSDKWCLSLNVFTKNDSHAV